MPPAIMFISVLAWLILALAFMMLNAGSSNPARIAIIAITTSNSMSVKARRLAARHRLALRRGANGNGTQSRPPNDGPATVSERAGQRNRTGRMSQDDSIQVTGKVRRG